MDYFSKSYHLLAILVTVAFIDKAVSQLPDYSSDHYVEDHASSSIHQVVLYSIREEEEDKPGHCRFDACLEETQYTDRQGVITWPLTLAGYRHYVRCPYAVYEPRYAYRDCELSGNVTLGSEWQEAVIDDCPETPAAEFILQMLNQVYSLTELSLRSMCAKLLDCLRQYYDQPIYSENALYTFVTLRTTMERAVTGNLTMTSSTADVVYRVLDWLVHTLDTQLHHSVLDFHDLPKVVWMFTILSEMIELPPGESSMTLEGDSATLHIEHTTGQILDNVVFKNRNAENFMTTNVTIEMDMQGSNVIRLLYLPITDYFQNVDFHDHWYAAVEADNDPDYDVILSYEVYNPYLVLSGPVFYVSVSTNPEDSWSLETWQERLYNVQDVNITYHMQHDAYKTIDADSIKCAQKHENITTIDDDAFDVSSWYGTNCQMVSNGNNNTTTSCVCQGLGYYGIFGEIQYTLHYPGIADRESTMEIFFGFTYNFGLYVTSHVFRAISLLGLVLTILSFVIHNKIRRGVPTRILLNLCSSLVILLIVLYIAEVVSYTRTGCRVSNVLRYYLVLVSLMWNGVEAFNMYLMLVKVFNHEIRHFVLKASIVAWGTPAVLVGIIFACSVKGFNGVYTDACIFRCQMRPTTMYYGYLLPLGIILSCNTVIFVLVLRVIRQNKSNISANKVRKRSNIARLVGAFSMMVLLGIPWFFSAFGAISPGQGEVMEITEAVLQFLFVFTVNLQGVFIFCFHCVRNADMRQQWKTTLSLTSMTSLRSSRGSGQYQRGSKEVHSQLSKLSSGENNTQEANKKVKDDSKV